MRHILFYKAFFYKKRKEIKAPKNYVYDHLLGAWINPIDRSLLISSQNFKALGTKKFDVETGEDHKGQ